VLTFGAVSMLVVFVIQAFNGWPDPKLVVLSIVGLIAFLPPRAATTAWPAHFPHRAQTKGE
jgi:hypothetical protein